MQFMYLQFDQQFNVRVVRRGGVENTGLFLVGLLIFGRRATAE
jgi:hypothetical protein